MQHVVAAQTWLDAVSLLKFRYAFCIRIDERQVTIQGFYKNSRFDFSRNIIPRKYSSGL